MPPFTPITLTTERLTLRWLTEAVVPALFAIFSDPSVMRYWSTPPLTELAQAEKMVHNMQSGYESGEFLQLGLERRATAGVIGTCTLFSFAFPSRRAEIGYALGRPFWGQGYVTEALRTLISYAFETLHLNRLEADIDPRNTASARVLERLGFQPEGYMRERWIVNDEVSDSALYGLLRREWVQTASLHQ
jgi:RimJ/RimL family protein N-acetyltransferase